MDFGSMKIKILKSAKDDLKEGFYFYEFQERDWQVLFRCAFN